MQTDWADQPDSLPVISGDALRDACCMSALHYLFSVTTGTDDYEGTTQKCPGSIMDFLETPW